MNPATITMDRSAAAAKADAYRDSLKRRRNEEYLHALVVYDELAKGSTVIDVGAAIRDSGFDDQMRPRLAIARADRRQVKFSWETNRDTVSFDSNGQNRSGRWYQSYLERINFNRFHNRTSAGGYGLTVEGYALVPLIPADVRPRGEESSWHILWEVEKWAYRPLIAEADRDPYLLKRLSGDLFVVLAEWDLTEVERMVTQGRARAVAIDDDIGQAARGIVFVPGGMRSDADRQDAGAGSYVLQVEAGSKW